MRKVLILLCLLMAAFAAGAQVKETVINDNFVDASTGWPEDVVRNEYRAVIKDGNYELQYDKTQGSKCFDIPLRMYLRENFFIETTGTITGGERQSGFGIVWGKGRYGYYAFVVTADSRFFVRKVDVRNGSEYLMGPVKCRYVRQANMPNKIRVQYADDELTFFINNRYVGHLPCEAAFGIRAGLVLYGRQQTSISNFGAYGTKSYDKLPGYEGNLMVASCEIEDGGVYGNGDCRIQPGETIQLAVNLRNNGRGRCDSLNARFYTLSNHVTVIDQQVVHRISNLEKGRTQTLMLKFRVESHCSVDKLNFRIDVTDDRGFMAQIVPLSVPMFTSIRPINRSDENDRVSFTFNFTEPNTSDINTYFPLLMMDTHDMASLIIGVEQYSAMPGVKARYATNDAKIFRSYMLNVCNMPRNNVIAISNQNATISRIRKMLEPGGELDVKRLYNNLTDVVVYFSGLAMCEPGRTEPYLMMYDSDPARAKATALPLSEFVRILKSYFSGKVICMFETSFAGVDREGRSFLPVKGSAWYNVSLPVVADTRTCLLYASGGGDPNYVCDATSHGLFTHELLTCMQTFANNRTQLDMRKLFDFINRNMRNEASRLGRNVFPRIDCKNESGILLLW